MRPRAIKPPASISLSITAALAFPLSFVVKNVQTGKEWNMVQKLRGFAHVVGHPIHPVAFDKDVIVIGTVAVQYARTLYLHHL